MGSHSGRKISRGTQAGPDLTSEGKTKAYIIDLTIRTETTVADIEVHNGKKRKKYAGVAEELRAGGFVDVVVHGLWFGSRGVVSKVGLTLLGIVLLVVG